MSFSTHFCSRTPSYSDHDPPFSHAYPVSESFTHSIDPPGPITLVVDPHYRCRQCIYNYAMPIDSAPPQDIAPALLDTTKWCPSLSFTGLPDRAIPELQFPPIGMVSNSCVDAAAGLVFARALANIQSTQAVSGIFDPRLGSLDPTGFESIISGDHLNHPIRDFRDQFGAGLDYPICDLQEQLPTSTSIEHITCSVTKEKKSPFVIYRPTKRKGPSRRRSRPTRAIDIEGIMIDEDDLHSLQGDVITVYECLWNKSNNPCGLWIVASRARVGAHIRKWHRQSLANSGARCLWDACNKPMLKDSISRHVLTAHFKEGFHCQGCDQVFPRQDVYDQHAEKDKACRDVGAMIVYRTQGREIKTSEVLHRGVIMQPDSSI